MRTPTLRDTPPYGKKPSVTDNRSGIDTASARAAALQARAANDGYVLGWQEAMRLQAKGAGAYDDWLARQRGAVETPTYGDAYLPSGEGGSNRDVNARIDSSGASLGVSSNTLLLIGAGLVLFLSARRR